MDHNAAVNVLIEESNRSPTRSLGELPFSIGRESPVESREVVRLRDGSADAWTLWVLKCIVYALVLKLSGFSDGVSAGLALAIGVLMFVIQEIVRTLGAGRELQSIEIPKLPNAGARVACVGPQWMIARCLGRWNDVQKTKQHAEIFRGVIGREDAVQVRSGWDAPILVLQILVWFVLLASGTSQPVVMWVLAVGLLGTLFARKLFLYVFRPVGVRIRPGLLEVIRLGRWGKAPQIVSTINLREAAVLVDGNASVLFVAHEGVTQEFDFIDASNKVEFSRAVLRAAVDERRPALSH